MTDKVEEAGNAQRARLRLVNSSSKPLTIAA